MISSLQHTRSIFVVTILITKLLKFTSAAQGCKPRGQGTEGFDMSLYHYDYYNTSAGPGFCFSSEYQSYDYMHGGYVTYAGGLFGTSSKITDLSLDFKLPELCTITNGTISDNFNYPDEFTISNFTMLLTGYFYAETTGEYTFLLEADDLAYLSFGAGNAFDCCGMEQSVTDPDAFDLIVIWKDTDDLSGNVTFSLNEGIYYPMRLLYTNRDFYGVLSLKYTDPSGILHSDFSDQIFQFPDSPGGCANEVHYSTTVWTGTYTTTYSTTVFTSIGSDGYGTIETIYYIETPTPTSTVVSSSTISNDVESSSIESSSLTSSSISTMEYSSTIYSSQASSSMSSDVSSNPLSSSLSTIKSSSSSAQTSSSTSSEVSSNPLSLSSSTFESSSTISSLQTSSSISSEVSSTLLSSSQSKSESSITTAQTLSSLSSEVSSNSLSSSLSTLESSSTILSSQSSSDITSEISSNPLSSSVFSETMSSSDSQHTSTDDSSTKMSDFTIIQISSTSKLITIPSTIPTNQKDVSSKSVSRRSTSDYSTTTGSKYTNQTTTSATTSEMRTSQVNSNSESYQSISTTDIENTSNIISILSSSSTTIINGTTTSKEEHSTGSSEMWSSSKLTIQTLTNHTSIITSAFGSKTFTSNSGKDISESGLVSLYSTLIFNPTSMNVIETISTNVIDFHNPSKIITTPKTTSTEMRELSSTFGKSTHSSDLTTTHHASASLSSSTSVEILYDGSADREKWIFSIIMVIFVHLAYFI